MLRIAWELYIACFGVRADKILLEYLINYNIVYSCYVLMRQALRGCVLYYYFHSLQSTYRTIINETIKLRK